MKINTLCKRLALQDVFESLAVEPGSALAYFELIRRWDDTGMRRKDLDDALANAISLGDLIDTYGDEGRLAILTEQGHERAEINPATLHQIEEFRQAMAALEWARQRARRGLGAGRGAPHPPALP
jgi:hypothetical protein